ncbi:hypothetical protein [Deinococcus fonticola]|uniref:hypothetical protein n=1 Tax=Deinococcus fonticola TaxID=2528713 RepID=UPI00107582E0|nr:hypothetical protein [Deinococcus fonticola]
MTDPEQTVPSKPSPDQQLATLIRQRFQAAGYLREQDLPRLELGLVTGDLEVEQWILLTENALTPQGSEHEQYGGEE